MTGMQRVDIGEVALEVEDRGAGEAVVFVHGANVAGTFLPMTRLPAFDGYRLVRYHRRGYGAGDVAVKVPLARHAADCRALLDALGIERAHVVGHSFGGCVALQLALDAPERVASLVLLEPSVLVEPGVTELRALLGPAYALWAAGEAEQALTAFWDAVQPGWRELDTGGAAFLEQALAGGPAMFDADLPALREWGLGPEQAAAVRAPVLYVISGEPLPLYRDNLAQLREQLPTMRSIEVPGTHHMLSLQQPAQVAGHAARFIAEHGAGAMPEQFHGIRPLPPRGRPVSNALVDQLREDGPD